MQQTILFIIFILSGPLSFSQHQNPWIRFYDSTIEYSGYKDLKGNIKLPARIGSFPSADTFYNIMAVTEIVDSTYKSYYLLKDGRKVGHDSVYMFDFIVDCESEGKIIFKDWKKDRVGFLNKIGTPIIPAIYNYVSPFRNGIAIAHQNAKRKCWEEGGDTTNCEHLGWEGGETILINDKNEILADSINVDLSNLNWYSKKVNDPSGDTSIYTTINGRNGITYSFVDYDKEFKKWYHSSFLQALKGNTNTLQSLLFDEVTYWSDKNGWTGLGKNAFLERFPGTLTTKRFEPNKLKEVSISWELFNEFIFNKDIYKKFLNSCGEHNRGKFPLYKVMLTYYKKRQKPEPEIPSAFLKEYEMDYQEHFEFLKTEKGYKLLSVSSAGKPTTQPYGKEVNIIDISGVCWHFVE